MSKKDYKKIASVVKEARDKTIEHKEDTQAIRHIISGLVKIFKEDNSLFNSKKFEDAIYD